MVITRIRHVIGFALVLGVVIYAAGCTLSALFIVIVPQSEDALIVSEAIESSGGAYGQHSVTESHIVGFANSFEQLKYEHNVRMWERERRWALGSVGIGAALGFIAFHVVPRRRGWKDVPASERSSAGFGVAVVGALAAMFIPAILGWMLPDSSTWLPGGIRRAAEEKRHAVLEQMASTAERFY